MRTRSRGRGWVYVPPGPSTRPGGRGFLGWLGGVEVQRKFPGLTLLETPPAAADWRSTTRLPWCYMGREGHTCTVIVDCQDAANNLAITPPAENAAMYSSSPSGPSRPAQGSARPGSPCYIPRASAQRHPHSTRSEQSRQTTPSPTSPTDPIPRRPSDSPNAWSFLP